MPITWLLKIRYVAATQYIVIPKFPYWDMGNEYGFKKFKPPIKKEGSVDISR
jgi:hypothetical protein